MAFSKSYQRSYSAGESTADTFSGDVSGIEIGIAYADTVVRTAAVDQITVKYTAGTSKIKFGAKVENGVFCAKESLSGIFGWGSNASSLEIELPAKEYGSISISAAAGKVRASGLSGEKLSVNTASGSGDYTVFANEISADVASGSVNFVNCTDRKANCLAVKIASGSAGASGFAADSFKIECASGKVSLNGISGEGRINMASGQITLGYSEWNGGLEIDAASGKIDAALPAGSGAEVDLSALAGKFKYELDGSSALLSGKQSSKLTVGGANAQKVKISLMSGTIELHN